MCGFGRSRSDGIGRASQSLGFGSYCLTEAFEKRKDALREAGATRCLHEGRHLLLLIEDRKRFACAFPDLALDTLALDARLRLAVKGEEI